MKKITIDQAGGYFYISDRINQIIEMLGQHEKEIRAIQLDKIDARLDEVVEDKCPYCGGERDLKYPECWNCKDCFYSKCDDKCDEETYYFINTFGKITECKWTESKDDVARKEWKNYFTDKSEAEEAREEINIALKNIKTIF